MNEQELNGLPQQNWDLPKLAEYIRHHLRKDVESIWVMGKALMIGASRNDHPMGYQLWEAEMIPGYPRSTMNLYRRFALGITWEALQLIKHKGLMHCYEAAGCDPKASSKAKKA